MVEAPGQAALTCSGSTPARPSPGDIDNAVNHARELAKANQPSQVIIHTRDGRIETEHTYGDDPRDVKG